MAVLYYDANQRRFWEETRPLPVKVGDIHPDNYNACVVVVGEEGCREILAAL